VGRASLIKNTPSSDLYIHYIPIVTTVFPLFSNRGSSGCITCGDCAHSCHYLELEKIFQSVYLKIDGQEAFALGSNYLIWSTNSLACMYSSARGVTLVSLGARFIAMIMQWNGECVAVVAIARMEFMTRVRAWLSFEWKLSVKGYTCTYNS